MEEIKRRLVTHRDCMDGSTCAIVFLTLFPDGEVVFVHPHEADTFPGRGDGTMTIFADVCPSYFLVDETVVDHHASNIEKLRGKEPEGAVLNTKKCGCLLLHETLSEMWKDIPKFKRLVPLCCMVNHYDLNGPGNVDSDWLADFHQLVGQEAFVHTMLRKGVAVAMGQEEPFFILSGEELEMVRMFSSLKQRYVNKACDQAFRGSYFWGERVIMVIADDHRNDIMCELLARHPEVDFAIVIDLLRNSGSVRSRDPKHDCAALVKKLGGGGHPFAAGFPLPRSAVNELRVVIGGDE